VANLWGLRQQRAEAVGLTDDPTVHVIVTEQQVSVTASEDGTQGERNGYAFRTHLGLPSGGSHSFFLLELRELDLTDKAGGFARQNTGCGPCQQQKKKQEKRTKSQIP